MRVISTGESIREGLEEVAKKDPSVLFFAEGVEDPSAVFGTIKNIGESIGHERMIEMPVAENGLCGIAIGAAMMGKRPVISFHRVEFALLAMEQIVNNAAKMHYTSNGQHKAPIVMRLIVGRGWGQGPGHSQSLETMFALIPGLKVIMPVYPKDAKGMIVSAVEDDSPVICIESRWAHYAQGEVPEGYYTMPLDGPKIIRQGEDITIVASSYMVLEAMRAADQLALEGISAEVIDLRVVRPLKMGKILKSVSKTGALMTVDLGFRTLGIGAEIVSETVQTIMFDLKKEPVRLGLPDHPIPSSRGLLDDVYPNAAKIVIETGRMFDLPQQKVAACLERLTVERGDLPMDVPDQYFNGPF